MNEMRIKFWCDAFKCAEGSVELCSKYADLALAEFDRRFNPYTRPGTIPQARSHMRKNDLDDDIPF